MGLKYNGKIINLSVNEFVDLVRNALDSKGENRIVRVMCRCGRITEQKDNGHFHEKVDFVRACTCKICSPESAHHQMEYFKRDGSRFYNGIKEE